MSAPPAVLCTVPVDGLMPSSVRGQFQAHKSRSDGLDVFMMTHIRASSGEELQRCAWPCAMEGEWGKTSVSVYSCSAGLDSGDAAGICSAPGVVS